MVDFSSPRPVCRPALPGDRDDVLEFTKFIWGGHDYIQYVWDDWLADPRGLLAVVEYGGHPVALGKATWLAGGQWWLEGLRVDPGFQGLKIGSRIFEYLDDWWKQHAGGAFRLMTSSERVQVHHLCERFGWPRIGEVREYAAAATSLAGGQPPLRPVAEDEIAQALRFASAHLGYCWGLADLGWRFARPDLAMLEEQMRESRLYWWGQADPAGLMGFWEDEEDGQRVMGLAFAACDLPSLGGMLADVRRLAGDLGYSSVLWHAPVQHDVEDALHAAGFEPQWEGTAYLFSKERSGPLTPPGSRSPPAVPPLR